VLAPPVEVGAVTMGARRGAAVRPANSPYYSNADRERLARQRKENRQLRREKLLGGPTQAALNMDKLPAVEDIYARKFSGNADEDPIGGRKRYTYMVLFKHNPADVGSNALKEKILKYIEFFKYKMSCRDIEARTITNFNGSPGKVSLEYPMKEYGELDRNKKSKDRVDRADMVEFKFAAPVNAAEYIERMMYADTGIVRFMVLGHTRTFKHVGEDNELHL